MQIEALDQLDGYDHIYLSPHLDDAVLSCGGTMGVQRAAGERVLLVTVCTGSPAPDAQFNDLTKEFHRRWGLAPAEVVAGRLREERDAMALLDGDSYGAGMLDSIYRHPLAYDSRAALFGTPAPGDPLPLTLRELTPHVARTHAGGAALRAARHRHARRPPDRPRRGARCSRPRRRSTTRTCPTRPGQVCSTSAWPCLEGGYAPQIVAIDAALEKKLAAIKAYASQLEQFGGADAMERTIGGYAQSLQPGEGGYGERFWAAGG